MAEKKKWYKRWYSKLGIGAFLTTIISENVKEYTKNIPLLKYAIAFFHSIYAAVGKFLNFEIKVWWLGLFLISFAAIIWIISKFKNPIYPPYIDYTSAVFRRWLWRWKWKYSDDGWVMTNLRPYCRDCEVQLVIGRDYYGNTAKCPKCNQLFTDSQNNIEYTEEIEKLILSEAERLNRQSQNQ